MKLPPAADMSLVPVSVTEMSHHKGDSPDNVRKGEQDYDYGMGSKWAGLVSEARELAARFNKDMSGDQEMMDGSIGMNAAGNGHMGDEDLGIDDDEDDEDGDDEDDEGNEDAPNVLKSVPSAILNSVGVANARHSEFRNGFPFSNNVDNSDSSDDDEDDEDGDGLNHGRRIPGNAFDIEMHQWSTDESNDSDFGTQDANQKELNFELMECKHCGKQYSKFYRLQRHEAAHEGKSTFPCQTCNQIFSSKAILEKHKEDMHYTWKCHLCTRACSDAKHLEIHIGVLHSGKYWDGKQLLEVPPSLFGCNHCGKGFPNKIDLKNHIESNCASEPKFGCVNCGENFTDQDSLLSHTLTHYGEQSYLCRFCGVSYRYKGQLKVHELCHTGEKPLMCNVCGKAFAESVSLASHMAAHAGVRPFPCNICNVGFSTVDNLLKHNKTNTHLAKVFSKFPGSHPR